MEESPRFANLDGVLKDGSPSYLKTLDLDNLQPMGAHGYVAVAPHESLEVSGFGEMSGTTIRDALVSGDEALFEEIMGWFDEDIYNMVKSKLGTLGEEVDFVDLTRMAIDEKKEKKRYMEPNMLQDRPDIIELDDEKLEAPAPTLALILRPEEEGGSAWTSPIGKTIQDVGATALSTGASWLGIPTKLTDLAPAALGWAAGGPVGGSAAMMAKKAADLRRVAAGPAVRLKKGNILMGAGESGAEILARHVAGDGLGQERAVELRPRGEEAYGKFAQERGSFPKFVGGVPVRSKLATVAPGEVRESKIIELDDEKLEEISAGSAGAAEGYSGSFPGLDVKKENEKEKKRSKQTAFDFVAEQDSVIQEITNYLLVKKGHVR
jgi:hypothetical protein